MACPSPAQSHTMRRHWNLGIYNSSQLCFHTNSTSHEKGNGNWTLLTKSFSCQTQFVRRSDHGVVMCSLSILFSLLGGSYHVVSVSKWTVLTNTIFTNTKKLEACEGQSCSTSNGYSGKAPHGFGKNVWERCLVLLCLELDSWTLVKCLRLRFLSQWSLGIKKLTLWSVKSATWLPHVEIEFSTFWQENASQEKYSWVCRRLHDQFKTKR